MKKAYLYFCGILAFFLCLAACSDDEVAPELFGTAYYPVTKGQYVTYRVHTVFHSEILPDSFVTFERREVVVDTFTDVSGQTAYRIEQFVRNTPESPWQIDSVWTLRKEPSRLVKIENNEPFIKLVFPTYDGTTWNGNALNDFPAEEYRAELLPSFSVEGQRFSNVLRIEHSADSSLVDKDVRYEMYAENIGMVYRRTEVFQFINNFLNPFYGQDSVVGGIYQEIRAIDWGIEPQ